MREQPAGKESSEPVLEVHSAESLLAAEPAKPLPSSKALASTILSILGFVTFFFPVLGTIGIIYGIQGAREIKKSRGRTGGAGFAAAGIIVGAASLVLSVLLVLALLAYGPFQPFKETQKAYTVQKALLTYAAGHGGKFPRSLEEVQPLIEPFPYGLKIDPSAYVYLGKDAPRLGEKGIVLYSARSLFEGLHVVFYATGELKVKQMDEILEELKRQGRNPPE